MLLKNGNTPALVARQLGYPNVQYFNLIFKKITGIAPCEYPYAAKLRNGRNDLLPFLRMTLFS